MDAIGMEIRQALTDEYLTRGWHLAVSDGRKARNDSCWNAMIALTEMGMATEFRPPDVAVVSSVIWNGERVIYQDACVDALRERVSKQYAEIRFRPVRKALWDGMWLLSIGTPAPEWKPLTLYKQRCRKVSRSLFAPELAADAMAALAPPELAAGEDLWFSVAASAINCGVSGKAVYDWYAQAQTPVDRRMRSEIGIVHAWEPAETLMLWARERGWQALPPPEPYIGTGNTFPASIDGGRVQRCEAGCRLPVSVVSAQLRGTRVCRFCEAAGISWQNGHRNRRPYPGM